MHTVLRLDFFRCVHPHDAQGTSVPCCLSGRIAAIYAAIALKPWRIAAADAIDRAKIRNDSVNASVLSLERGI